MARTKKPRPELTAHQMRWLERIRQEGGMIQTRSDDGEEYSTVTGAHVNIRIATKLIDLGKVAPQQDGLFPGETQTFVAA
jgi:hypothetical protein